MIENDNTNPFSFIADFEGDIAELCKVEIPEILDILPIRGTILFPCVMTPITVKRTTSLQLLKRAYKDGTIFGVFTQIDPAEDELANMQLETIGVAAKVVKILELPDGQVTAIVQGFCRLKRGHTISIAPNMKAIVHALPDVFCKPSDTEFLMLVEQCRQRSLRLVSTMENVPEEARFAIKNISNDVFLINFLCTSMPIANDRKMDMLANNSVKDRAIELLKSINTSIQLNELKQQIQEKTHLDLSNQQKEYFLQQEMRNIQDQLNGGNTPKDSDDLRKKAEKKDMPENVKGILEDEIQKLDRLNPQSPDYNVQLNYLQTILQLPWNECTTDNLSISDAEKVLNHDHYGMDDVKERILEHLAVLQLRGDMKSPIICLYGPPGVGKTSLGRSIAESLKRKYVRMSLGGLHDESEIRGHRRTYIGAMPGRILKNIIKAGSNNPVFILDEIDKIGGQTVNGDPSSALLEVLDPEQNNAFHDNFLDIDYDLSKVLFIATANDISNIPRPLLDRMELIEVGGYCTEEKIEIARKHLFPKAKENNGLKDHKKIKINKAAIEFIVEHYTRESGVRGLEKQINKLMRKVALDIAKNADEDSHAITPAIATKLLGKPIYNRDIYQGNEFAGVVTGLAWTSVGGEILYIETSLSKGKAGKLTLTGNLGDVMKESAMLALEYIKAHADQLDIDTRIFDNWNIHLHVPEGATPKDGPSAGITMVTSLTSALTQRKVRSHLAMTGEITLRGKVLPVGGIKEKLLAAHRAGIRHIIISEDNRKDVEDIPEMYMKGVEFHCVKNIDDVLSYALLTEKVNGALKLTIEEEKEEAK